MKKFLLLLLAVSCFGISDASNSLQITKLVLNPAPQCATVANPAPTTTVTVTVAGGVLPYAFTIDRFGVNPVVNPLDPHTATFIVPVQFNDDLARISVTDSSVPAKNGTVFFSFWAQALHSLTFTFSPPCNGNANGRISVTVDGGPAAMGFELSTENTFSRTLGGTSVQFTDLLRTQYTVTALSTPTCPTLDGQTVVTSLVEIDPIPVSSLEDYIQRAYCDGCFGPR